MDKTKRMGSSLSWDERKAMIQEYLTGNFSKTEIWKKYTGQLEEHGQILRWMRKLGYTSNEISVERKKYVFLAQQVTSTLDTTDNIDKDPMELQKRIEELEKQLKIAQLKAEGYELMIEIAEKELSIPIRKKSGTK